MIEIGKNLSDTIQLLAICATVAGMWWIIGMRR